MPEYTLTEDYALGMELKMRKWQVRRLGRRPCVPLGHHRTWCKAPMPNAASCDVGLILTAVIWSAQSSLRYVSMLTLKVRMLAVPLRAGVSGSG